MFVAILVLGLLNLALVGFLTARTSRGPAGADRLENALRAEMAQNRKEAGEIARAGRDETSSTIKNFNDSMLKSFASLSGSSETKFELLRQDVHKQLQGIQESNEKKLEEMRKTVDEKLHETLENRLGQSFKIVSDRLVEVHKGLGEMQSLAAGVGDLKKVLTNVKTRGIFGELQLENLLEQILTPDQYSKNVATKHGSSDRVEFAIRMPGGDDGPVWLPIDAKFPAEYYHRYIDACEKGDLACIETAKKELGARLVAEAKSIREKYVDPPQTTGFAVLFLPFESLYADAIKMDVIEISRREYNVEILGPSLLSAYLNSLQMGFRTLAIQKRSSEVWSLLGTVKNEFGKFGEILLVTQKKLESATESIKKAASKSRTIEKKLRDVGQAQLSDEADPELLAADESEAEKLV